MDAQNDWSKMTDDEKHIVRALRRINRLWRHHPPRFMLSIAANAVALSAQDGREIEKFSSIGVTSGNPRETKNC